MSFVVRAPAPETRPAAARPSGGALAACAARTRRLPSRLRPSEESSCTLKSCKSRDSIFAPV